MRCLSFHPECSTADLSIIPRGPRVKPLLIRSLQSFDDPRGCQSLGQHPFIFKKPTSCILDFVLEAWTLTELTVHDVESNPANPSSSLAIQFAPFFRGHQRSLWTSKLLAVWSWELSILHSFQPNFFSAKMHSTFDSYTYVRRHIIDVNDR